MADEIIKVFDYLFDRFGSILPILGTGFVVYFILGAIIILFAVFQIAKTSRRMERNRARFDRFRRF